MTMPALSLVMTTAGLGRFTAAQIEDDIDLTIAYVGLTNADFIVAPTLTALPGQFRRLSTISGQSVGDNIVHMIIRDEDPETYAVRGFGLFLADGTLFAVYGQSTKIFEKSASSTMLLAIDIAFPTSDIERLVFGDTNFLNPPATTAMRGVVELATLAEATTGDTQRVTTGAVVKAMIDYAIAAVGEALDGLMSRTMYGSGLVKGGGNFYANRTLTVDAASGVDVRDGIALDLAVTPASLKAAGIVYLVESRTDGASRWRRYSDGLVEMTGVSALPASEASFTLNFPWPFPVECEGIFATIINTAQTNDGQSTVQEVALAPDRALLFAQNHKMPTADAAGGFRWLARGR